MVAEKYRVNAIPETIIIDAEGKIVRVFIGGDSNFGDSFRAALEQVLGIAQPEPMPEETFEGT